MLKINKENIEHRELSGNEQERIYYMQDVLDTIKELNIKNFNYIIFEEDLDNMHKTEFEEFFNKYVTDLIDVFNHYVAIDIEAIYDEPYRIKISFVKNIVRFMMNTLPYIYMKGYLNSKDIDGLHDALDEIQNISNTDIVNQISEMQRQYSSFNNMMADVSDKITSSKKKVKFSKMLDLLDTNMENKHTLLDYYKSIIQNSGHDGVIELLSKYIKNDLENII